MMFTHRYARAILIVATLFPTMVCGCRREIADPPPIAVRVAKLEREPINLETRFSATVRERQRTELSFKVPGTVETLLQVKGPDGKLRDVQEGDVVTADAQHPLAHLDDSDYKRRVAAAQERLAQARAKERAVTANLTAVRANFARVDALRERGSIAQQAYDDVLAKRDALVAELEATQREIGAVTVALQQAEDDQQHCALLAPMPKGTVSRKYVEGHERVLAGQPVIEIMDLSQVRIAFGVADTGVDRFRLGQSVTVMADAFHGQRFVGQVTKIRPAADLRTRSFEVEVTIDDPKQLRPGMVVTIIVGQREEMVLIPLTAIQRGASTDDLTVYAITDKKGSPTAQKRRVKLDGVYDNRMRLVEGSGCEVKADDVIVVAGTFRLTDGQAVRVLDLPKSVMTVTN